MSKVMPERLHSSNTLVEGMSGVEFAAGTSRKRDLEVKIQEPRLFFEKYCFAELMVVPIDIYIYIYRYIYISIPKGFPALLTSSQESKARLEKLRRKLSNQPGGNHPTGPPVSGVLVAFFLIGYQTHLYMYG